MNPTSTEQYHSNTVYEKLAVVDSPPAYCIFMRNHYT